MRNCSESKRLMAVNLVHNPPFYSILHHPLFCNQFLILHLSPDIFFISSPLHLVPTVPIFTTHFTPLFYPLYSTRSLAWLPLKFCYLLTRYNFHSFILHHLSPSPPTPTGAPTPSPSITYPHHHLPLSVY